MPLHASLIRSIASHRLISIAAVALWFAAAASFVHPATRAQLSAGFWLRWPALAALVGGLGLVAAIAGGTLTPAVRRRLPNLLALFSAPAFLLVAGSGGMRSPAVAVAGLLLMGVTATFGYRAGAMAAGASVLVIALADSVLG